MRVADPVKAGLVRSLGHPGANVTGLSFLPDVLAAKAIEALHQTVPSVSRIAAFYKADNPGALLVVTETERRSAERGIQFERFSIRDPADFPDAFAAAARGGAQAAFVMDDGAMTKLRYVDRILRGAKPSELPVEQADRFHFAINLKTTKALGPTIPPSLLLRADQLIE